MKNTTNAATIKRLTNDTVIEEALRYYLALQDWTMGALHSTDAERELARYRKAAAQDALDVLAG